MPNRVSAPFHQIESQLTGTTIVRVRWARLTATQHLTEPMLGRADVAAVARHRRVEDRARTSLGIVLARRAVAAELDVDVETVELVRVCGRCGGPHGKPRVGGVELSIAHAGDMVVVALCRTAAVGVDVELVSRFSDAVLPVLGAGEAADGACELATYWCRKESVAKATGAGLRVPLREVIVTRPDEQPALVTYRGRWLPAVIADLPLAEGYAAAVTVLAQESVVFDVPDTDTTCGCLATPVLDGSLTRFSGHGDVPTENRGPSRFRATGSGSSRLSRPVARTRTSGLIPPQRTR